MEKEVRVVVIGAIRNSEGKILISQRNDPKMKGAHLKWDFVGGSHEFGEDPKETLRREVLEEADIAIEVGKLMPEVASHIWECDQQFINAIVLCYECKTLDEKISSHDPKIAELRWVPIEEFKNYDFLPTLPPFIKILAEGGK